MSAVIKAVALGAEAVRPLAAESVRPPAVAGAAASPEPAPELLVLRQELDALAAASERQTAEIARLKAEVERARQEGLASGRRLGRQEAEDQAAAQLAALRAGLQRAVESFRAEVAGLEGLSALVARHALEKVLGEGADQAELVGRIVRRQMAVLRDEAVLTLEVSRRDFPTPEALAPLAETVSDGSAVVRASDRLQSGDCRIQLALGGLDVGVGTQLSRLSAALADLAAREP